MATKQELKTSLDNFLVENSSGNITAETFNNWIKSLIDAVPNIEDDADLLQNIGSHDLVVAGANRVLRLAGDTSGETFSFSDNSGNTIVKMTGDRTAFVETDVAGFGSAFSIKVNNVERIKMDSYRNYLFGVNHLENIFVSGSQDIQINSGLGLSEQFKINPKYGRIVIGGVVTDESRSNLRIFRRITGVAPTQIDNSFAMYSDEFESVLMPHFVNSNGDVIRLLKSPALTPSTGDLSNAVTRISEIESILEKTGLI